MCQTDGSLYLFFFFCLLFSFLVVKTLKLRGPNAIIFGFSHQGILNVCFILYGLHQRPTVCGVFDHTMEDRLHSLSVLHHT